MSLSRCIPRFPTRRILLVGIGAALALGAGLLASARPADAPASGLGPRPALSVTLEQPQTMHWEQAIVAHGAIEPWQELIVGARTGGLPLAEVKADVGDTPPWSWCASRPP